MQSRIRHTQTLIYSNKHTYVYADTHTFAQTRIRSDKKKHLYADLHMLGQTYIRLRRHTYVQTKHTHGLRKDTYIRTMTHTYGQKYIRLRRPTYVWTGKHTYTQIHTCLHKHTCVLSKHAHACASTHMHTQSNTAYANTQMRESDEDPPGGWLLFMICDEESGQECIHRKT